MILLTGANGFVGYALYLHLTKRNLPVLAVSRSVSSPDKFKQVALVGDIDAKTDWSNALGGVQAVVHLAARVHVMADRSADPLLEYRQVNVEGTKNLALQAAQAGVKRFIFLSSVKVNGESTVPGHPFNADDAPHPEDAYAVSKWEAEQVLFDIAFQTGMEVVIIRPPLVYGAGVKANFQSLMKAVQGGWPLPLGAVTQNRRSLVSLDNLVDFITVCLNHPAAANQVFMVSDGQDLSTAGLLQKMYEASGASNRLFKVPPWLLNTCATVIGKHSVYQRLCGSLQVDISPSKQLLGWTPPVSVEEGLRRAFNGL